MGSVIATKESSSSRKRDRERERVTPERPYRTQPKNDFDSRSSAAKSREKERDRESERICEDFARTVRELIQHRANYPWKKSRIQWDTWAEMCKKKDVRSLVDFIGFFAEQLVTRQRGNDEIQCFLDAYVELKSKSEEEKLVEMDCLEKKMILRHKDCGPDIYGLFAVITFNIQFSRPFIKCLWEPTMVFSEISYTDLLSVGRDYYRKCLDENNRKGTKKQKT